MNYIKPLKHCGQKSCLNKNLPLDALRVLQLHYIFYSENNKNAKKNDWENISEHRENIRQKVRENIEEKAKNMKGEGKRRKEFRMEDKVMVKELGLKRKAFETRYQGPFIITNKFNGVTYEVKDINGRTFKRHRDHLKPTDIANTNCISEDIYSRTSFASTENIKTANMLVRPKRNHKPVQRYGFDL